MPTQIEETQTRLEEQLVRLDLLQRMTRAIAERQDLPSILQVIVGRLEGEFPVEFACVVRVLPAEGVLLVESLGSRAAALSNGRPQPRERIPLDDHCRKAVMQNTVLYEPDLVAVQQPMA